MGSHARKRHPKGRKGPGPSEAAWLEVDQMAKSVTACLLAISGPFSLSSSETGPSGLFSQNSDQSLMRQDSPGPGHRCPAGPCSPSGR